MPERALEALHGIHDFHRPLSQPCAAQELDDSETWMPRETVETVGRRETCGTVTVSHHNQRLCKARDGWQDRSLAGHHTALWLGNHAGRALTLPVITTLAVLR